MLTVKSRVISQGGPLEFGIGDQLIMERPKYNLVRVGEIALVFLVDLLKDLVRCAP